ncbi:hypothetical protein [Glutamicibacter sp. AOP5-A2-18]|uniref:hypothetical protein n=1 Tax=Glutamicibacter sp. AOP5-A2-18 TaxID=3457656 RepID=UPI0040349CFE
MSMEQTHHRCHACNEPFPAGADKRRKYCGDACRMRQNRARQRGGQPQASAADVLAIQNKQLHEQLSRARAELAKVHNRAMGYRKETKAARKDLKRFTEERQRSLLYFQNQHQELRAKYRLAHTMIIELGHQLHAVSDGQTTWEATTTAPASMQRGPLPSDDDNTAALVELVASVSRQLDDTFGLRHYRPRTLRDNDTLSSAADATLSTTTTTGPSVAVAQTSHDDIIVRQRDTIAKADKIINTLSERLTIAKTAHMKLRDQYSRSQQALSTAATQREQHRVIITQWRVMARELYRRTGGRPTEQRHRDILATMNRYESWVKGQNQ